MPIRRPHRNATSDRLKDALERARGLARNLSRTGREAAEAIDPFGAASDRGAARAFATLAEENTQGHDVIRELAAHARRLGPLVKRRILDLEDTPGRLKFGWAQLPGLPGGGFSIGVFADRDHFSQIAYADAKGRVFVGSEIGMDVQSREPRLIFTNEHHAGRIGGGIVGRDRAGRLMWLASWKRENGLYTLEQLRYPLPETQRRGLEYRDAVAAGFLAAYMLPQTSGLLIGFGAGNIFRRLNREAPMGAIRRSIRDTLETRAHGMRVSGLEDHFAALMREAGALDDIPGLEAVHGAEPLHLYTSSYSGSYFFSWDASMALTPALRALAIEGNLNRFAAVSAWLERNARLGLEPTEETVTHAQAATIDMDLMEDPALLALGPGEAARAAESGRNPLLALADAASRIAREVAEGARDGAEDASQGPAGRDDAAHSDAGDIFFTREGEDPFAREADISDASGASDAVGSSEWAYRQSMALLVRRLRLPYRFDAEIRSNLAEGRVAIGFTTAGVSMMPASRYDQRTHRWATLSDEERAAMSAAYNLRVGLIMAALSFGASARVREVSLHVDSLGLEEAVAEQDTAIERLMSEALGAFERMHTGDVGMGRDKAEPKDGDVHGDPTLAPALGGEPENAAETADKPDRPDTDGVPDASGLPDGAASDGDREEGDDDIERRFADLMRGIDIDETAFAAPVSGRNGDMDDPAVPEARPALSIGFGQGDAPIEDDPMSILKRNPTVRNLATVTFTRDAFLRRAESDGLAHPADTYRMFGAVLDLGENGALHPVDAGFDLRDERFAPEGSQTPPESDERDFGPETARTLGTDTALGLSIQREDLLRRAERDLHRLASEDMPSVAKAQTAMRLIERIGDPELDAQSSALAGALIDGEDTPDLTLTLSEDLDRDRVKARDLLFSGRIEQAFEVAEDAVGRIDAMYARAGGVPRYFNSYAERVIYNRMFATPGERTVLIPDNLFYAHMELSDVLGQIKGAHDAMDHLNMMVAYAPAYPLAHLKLALHMAQAEDWDSARAACLNALRVALDRDDAAFAYYRFAYAEWMQDRFDTAAAAYIMSDHICSGRVPGLEGELQELVSRADSQCIRVPETVEEATFLLAVNDLPVWPHTEAGDIVREAARLTVDEGMFVPARTLSVAAARMNDGDGNGIDVVQAQFIRSLAM